MAVQEAQGNRKELRLTKAKSPFDPEQKESQPLQVEEDPEIEDKRPTLEQVSWPKAECHTRGAGATAVASPPGDSMNLSFNYRLGT